MLLCVPKKYRSKDIRGNVALVTGGGSGIGRLMCLKLAAKGALVVTWDVSEKGESHLFLPSLTLRSRSPRVHLKGSREEVS